MLKVILETGGNYMTESQFTRQNYQLILSAPSSLALKIKELIFLIIWYSLASIVIYIFGFIESPVNSNC